MTKEFMVTIDVIMSGDIYIEADTQEEAIKKAKEKYFNAGDLRNFHFLSSDIIEYEEVKE